MNPQSWTYLSFRIKNIFTSEYAYRLYERCRADQFRSATDWWSIDEFRALMNITNLYPNFQDLNKRVIKLAVDQINEHSDIYVTPDYQTRGRTKTHIRFVIEENPNVVKFAAEKEKMPTEIFNALKVEFGFSNSQVDEVADYPIEYLAQKIEFARYRIKTSKTVVKSRTGYLLKALKEDLQFNSGEIAAFESEKRKNEERVASEFESSVVKEKSQRTNNLLLDFENLDEAHKEALLAAFKSTDEYELVKKAVGARRISMDNPQVKVAFANFLEEQAIVA